MLIATVLAVAIVVFGVGQLVLPGIADHVVRTRLSRYGRVLDVSVSATPAIELAFGDADSVRVHMASFRGSERDIVAQLAQAKGVTSLSVEADRVSSGILSVTHAQMTKHGAQLDAGADLSAASLHAAIPEIDGLTLEGSGSSGITLGGTALGISGSVVVAPVNGRVLVIPQGLAGDLLGSVTVWSDPRIPVQSVAARTIPGGLALSAHAHLG